MKNNKNGPKDQGNLGEKNEKSGPRNQGQRGQQKGGNQQQGQQGGRRNRGSPNREKDQGPPRRERNRTSSSSSAGKGEESPDGSPKKNRSQRRREQYRRRQFDRNGAENGDEKQEPKDAKPANKDSPPKASESNDKTNNSKPQSSTNDSKIDDKPLVNGTPANVPETNVEHENGHDNKSDSNSKPERPKELNVTHNGPKVEKETEKVVNNHISTEDNSIDKKDKVIPNGDVHIKDEPVKDEIHNCKSSSDKPIMNGGLSSGGEVSPSEPVKESGDSGLPQRQPRERRERQKGAAEVVKEVSAMNGVVATGDDDTAVDH